ncbi:MAG: FHA domain-containing protein [Acidobacteriota bacterium]
MRTDQGEWILTEGELAAAAKSLGLARGVLDALPGAAPAPDEVVRTSREVSALEPALKGLFEKALSVLASPARVVRFHTAAADTRVSRSLLAFSPSLPGVWVSLARGGDERRVSLRTQAELRLLVARHLAAGDSLNPDRVGADLSTHGVLALLAACAQIRRARLIALLRHEEAAEVFSPHDIQARLEEAATADFRWPLSFVAPMIPLPVKELGVTKDPRPALVELARAGFLEPVTESETPLFEMSPGGRVFAEGLCQEASRGALSVARAVTGDQIAYDVMLFCRGPFNLFSFFMSGEVGFATTLLAGDLDELLQYAFSEAAPPPPSRSSVQAKADASDSERTVLEAPACTPAWIVVEKGQQIGRRIALFPGASAGRKEDNLLCVPDPGASRKHLAFTLDEEGAWQVEDAGSSNGTFVNETRIGAPVRLKEGDLVRLGQTVLRVTFTPGA